MNVLYCLLLLVDSRFTAAFTTNKQRCKSQGDMPTLCTKANDLWSVDELRGALPIFFKIYLDRPIRANFHGISMNHAFSIWFLAQKLKPSVIIESGVYRGQGTWMLRNGSGPDTKIYSIDPRNPSILVFRDASPRTTYFMGDKFHDFGKIPWSKLLTPQEIRSTLVVLDDHMSSVKRTLQALRVGFQHLWYDDNWKYEKADCYSFNTVCSPSHGTKGVVYKDNFGAFSKVISYEEHRQNVVFLQDNIDAYFEFPPIYNSCEQILGKEFQRNQSGLSWRQNLLSGREVWELGKVNYHANPEFFTYFPPYVRLRQHDGIFDEASAIRTTPLLLEISHRLSPMKVSGAGIDYQGNGSISLTGGPSS